MKRPLKRYISHDKPKPCIVLTGKVLLKYMDDEEIETAKKGDIFFYHNTENTPRTLIKGDYLSRGLAGYFKADVFDGREWRLLAMQEFYPQKEHHFSKTERSIDTYMLCKEIMESFAGREVKRTYREHYELVDLPPQK